MSFNYRLASIGFLGLKEENEDGVNGNFGLYDQNAVLKWVNANIAAFGGDPDEVTLMGQSTGGQSVFVHNQWDKSWNLFNKMIVDSGPAVTIQTGATPDQYFTYGSRFVRQTECRETARIWQCLRSLSVDQLRNASRIFPQLGEGSGALSELFRPVGTEDIFPYGNVLTGNNC